MPRKKSVGGRSRGVTEVNRLMRQTQQLNRMFKALENADRFGTYRSRELLEYISRDKAVNLKTSKSSKKFYTKVKVGDSFKTIAKTTKRHTIDIDKTKLTPMKIKALRKIFKEYISSKGMTPKGIASIEEKTRETLKQTLKEKYDRNITKQDLERWDNYFEFQKKNSILDYVDPSDFHAICDVAIKKGYSVNKFVETLSNYVEINNDYYRDEARKLYEQFVAPYK